MVLQVWVVTGCTRYSLEVAGAVTSRPLPPPPGHPHLHELITRQHTRVSSQRFLLYFILLSSLSLSLSLFSLFVLPLHLVSLICKSSILSFSLATDLLTTCYARFIFSLVVTLSIHDSRYVSIVVDREKSVNSSRGIFQRGSVLSLLFKFSRRESCGNCGKNRACVGKRKKRNWKNVGIENF